jgi:hypothetical protein
MLNADFPEFISLLKNSPVPASYAANRPQVRQFWAFGAVYAPNKRAYVEFFNRLSPSKQLCEQGEGRAEASQGNA